MHVGIDIAHQIVGKSHTVAVAALLGIIHHVLYLAQGKVVFAAEDVGIDEMGPQLIVLLPVLHGSQPLQIERYIFEDGVVLVVIIEQDDAIHQSTSQHGLLVLFVQFGNKIVQGMQLQLIVTRCNAGSVDFLKGF